MIGCMLYKGLWPAYLRVGSNIGRWMMDAVSSMLALLLSLVCGRTTVMFQVCWDYSTLRYGALML